MKYKYEEVKRGKLPTVDSVQNIETMKLLSYSIESTQSMFLKWHFFFMLLIAKGGQLYYIITILEKIIQYYTIPVPMLAVLRISPWILNSY